MDGAGNLELREPPSSGGFANKRRLMLLPINAEHVGDADLIANHPTSAAVRRGDQEDGSVKTVDHQLQGNPGSGSRAVVVVGCPAKQSPRVISRRIRINRNLP